jgi:HPt (histidine-containing phosphotransfer) domain-containing protein
VSDKVVVEVERDLEDLVPVFLRAREDDLRKLLTALEGTDFATMRLVGHSMKGAAGAYGFAELARLGNAIEVAALAGDAGVVRAQAERMRDHLARLEIRFC